MKKNKNFKPSSLLSTLFTMEAQKHKCNHCGATDCPLHRVRAEDHLRSSSAIICEKCWEISHEWCLFCHNRRCGDMGKCDMHVEKWDQLCQV